MTAKEDKTKQVTIQEIDVMGLFRDLNTKGVARFRDNVITTQIINI